MTKQCYLSYVFHYCPLLNGRYHAVIEQEQNISGERQCFLEMTGWNCKGTETLWIVSLRYWHNQGTNIPWNFVKCRQIPVKLQREDCVIHRSETLENFYLGKSLLRAQRVHRKVCRLESEYFYNWLFFHSFITTPLQRMVKEKFEWQFYTLPSSFSDETIWSPGGWGICSLKWATWVIFH